MCFGAFKKKPRLTVAEVIVELEYDILIHEAYAGLVVDEPHIYFPSVYGDYDWHMRWIEVYEAAVFYLKGRL